MWSSWGNKLVPLILSLQYRGIWFLNFLDVPLAIGVFKDKTRVHKISNWVIAHIYNDDSLESGLYTGLWDIFLGNTLKKKPHTQHCFFKIQFCWIKIYSFCPLILQLLLWYHFHQKWFWIFTDSYVFDMYASANTFFQCVTSVKWLKFQMKAQWKILGCKKGHS